MEKSVKNPAELGRGAGILMAVNSLPSDYGIGTMGSAARTFIDMLADIKMRYWQVLPMGPTGMGDSPYQPISAFAGNNYLIDLDELAAMGLLKPDEIRAYDWGSSTDEIDYATMYNNRILILKKAYERFGGKNAGYQAFIKNNAYWLEDYALFSTIKEAHNGVEWTKWESGLKDRDEKEIAAFKADNRDEIDFYCFCQYIFHTQWSALRAYAKSKGIKIIGDISLYVAHDSADVWANRDIFALTASGEPRLVSAMPSDEFFPKGQIWGSPVYDWEKMDNDGFAWWRQRFAKAADMYDAVRLDHFIGVVKYYAVGSASGRSDSGRWYKGPSRRFMDAVMKALNDTPLIVDDAGPRQLVPGVNKLIDKWNLTRSRILVYGWDKGSENDNLPHNYPNADIAVYTTTHDTETLTGFIQTHMSSGKTGAIDYMSRYLDIPALGDLSQIKELTSLSAESADLLAEGNIRLAYASNAKLAIIPIQDILGLGNEARMNAPSTVFGNWQWRVGTHKLSEERKTRLRELALRYRR